MASERERGGVRKGEKSKKEEGCGKGLLQKMEHGWWGIRVMDRESKNVEDSMQAGEALKEMLTNDTLTSFSEFSFRTLHGAFPAFSRAYPYPTPYSTPYRPRCLRPAFSPAYPHPTPLLPNSLPFMMPASSVHASSWQGSRVATALLSSCRAMSSWARSVQ